MTTRSLPATNGSLNERLTTRGLAASRAPACGVDWIRNEWAEAVGETVATTAPPASERRARRTRRDRLRVRGTSFSLPIHRSLRVERIGALAEPPGSAGRDAASAAVVEHSLVTTSHDVSYKAIVDVVITALLIAAVVASALVCPTLMLLGRRGIGPGCAMMGCEPKRKPETLDDLRTRQQELERSIARLEADRELTPVARSRQ